MPKHKGLNKTEVYANQRSKPSKGQNKQSSKHTVA